MSNKKIPRSIKKDILDELTKIDKDINIAIETLLFQNSRKLDSKDLWNQIEDKVQNMIDREIEKAKKGW